MRLEGHEVVPDKAARDNPAIVQKEHPSGALFVPIVMKSMQNFKKMQKMHEKFAYMKKKQYFCTVKSKMSGRTTAIDAAFILSVCVSKSIVSVPRAKAVMA